jgi:RHS repeat-associated protein
MKHFYFTFLFLSLSFFSNAQGTTSTEVGITEGQLSVSLSGGATYAIPIAVPPGITGVVPQLSLTYNSQGGNGMAGYGWNISGVSSITRIPATTFHDDRVGVVDLSTSDRFALDGQRLLVKQGTNGVYGADGTVYETESFSNIKITSRGTNGNGPTYFIVESPDGSTAYYGTDTTTKSLTEWAIVYWQNPQGVRINYSYTLANNVLSIASITYGTKIGITPINEVQFIYKSMQRPEQGYVGGQSFTRNKVLSEIKITTNGIGFRNYKLDHDKTTLGYDRLITVTEKSGDNSKSYNPTRFDYENKETLGITPSWTTSSIGLGGINSQTSATVSGDFDGDGKMDFALYPTEATLKNKFWLFTDLKNGSFNSPRTIECGKFEEIFPATFLNDTGKMMPAQGITTVQFTQADKAVNFNVYRNTAYGVGVDYSKKVYFPIRQNCTLENATMLKKYLSGDFNGDGLTDVIAIDSPIELIGCNSPSTKAYFIDLDRRILSNFWNDAGTLSDYQSKDRLEAYDVNGDGKTEILHFKKGNVAVYSLNNAKQLVLLWKTTDTDINPDFGILPGDYNGDGKMDFIIAKGVSLYTNTYAKFTATGTGFIKTDQTYPFRNIGSYSDNQAVYTNVLIPLDFNGDGKTDMVYFRAGYGKGLGRFTIESYRNDDSGFTQSHTFDSDEDSVPKRVNQTKIKASPIPIFLTPSKNNQYLEVGAITDDLIYNFSLQKDYSKETLINTITTGNGVTETITYSPLQQDPYEPFYTPTVLTETFPNVDINVAPNFKIVTKLEKKSATTYKKQLFNYSGAVSNVAGLGFLGFRSTTRTNWYDDKTAMITSLARNDMSLRGANVEAYTVLGYHSILTLPPAPETPKTLIKEGNYIVSGSDNLVATQQIILKPNTHIVQGSTFTAKINRDANQSGNSPVNYITKLVATYESELLSNKVFKLKSTNGRQYNALENTSTETTTNYDAYNNPLQSTTLVKEAGAIVQTNISTVKYQEPTTGQPYILGRPESKIQTITITGDVATSEETYEYNPAQLLWKIKKRADASTNYVTEENLYDGFGNINQKTITAGSDKRITNYLYDPTGRFLTYSTDIEGLTTGFIYNPDGTLQSETNPYGLTTTYEYDSWFKKKKTIDYLGKSNNYLYTRLSEKTKVTTTGDDGSACEELFDDLGRKIKSGVKNINNTFSYVDYQYDIYDRNYGVSEPYFGASPSQWNTVEYDDYGRVKTTTTFTGKIINTQYSGLTTTVNDGTKTKTIIKNGIGNVVSMTEAPGGTITYTYYANGNLRESNFGGVKTTIKQDPWGRKTELNDSSAGIYKYQYNDFGEITSEETPNGITTYNLTSLGKLDNKTIKDPKGSTNSTTAYTYDGASKLLINSVFKDLISNTTITTGYNYDGNNRIVRTTETSSTGAVFTKNIGSYDAFGRVESETTTASLAGKSSAKTIVNTYKNGAHWQMLDNGVVVWQANTVNARGQLLTAVMSNGNIAITNAYDNDGYATQSKYDRMNENPGNILTLGMAFDPKKGNLKSRTNSLFGWNESFEYDSLDRLTKFINTQGKQETQLYDDQGRITQNDLGIYGYKTDKPYQNNAITLTPEAEAYYIVRPSQVITYNTFKSPIQIEEKGIDKLSFVYNDNNDRHVMYYGGLQDEVLLRNNRKYYSADGSMEIKQDMTTGAIEFVTYIGGDGYNAPAVVKSDGTTQKYLYLLRDYQGSILAITDQSGYVQEKRLFDAWGAIIKVQDGFGVALIGLTLLDRGYTGHEHLQSVGLINMNGRLYDAKLHRFLQPDNHVQDPSNVQNYNRYAYVLNNPLKFTDPSGESWLGDNGKTIFVFVAAAATAVIIGLSMGTATPLVAAAWAGAGAGFVGGALGTMLNGGTVGQSLMAGVIGGATGAVLGVAGAAMSAAIGAVGIIPGMLSGAATSTTVGALANILAGQNWDQNLGFNGIMGAAGGGISGLQAARASGSGIWFGTAAKPQATVIATNVNNSTKEAQVAYDKSVRSQVEPTIYRAVSKAELNDITEFGFRTIEGGYETGKLFAPTFKEAAQFGKNNFMFDGIPNTVIKVEIPNSVLNSAFKFGADGMDAISIPSNQLNLLKGTPTNNSPWLR